jgi:hypothetical protein
MKIPGYCEKCHKIRTVRVTRFRPHTNVQTGICSLCEIEQTKKLNERYARQARRKQT